MTYIKSHWQLILKIWIAFVFVQSLFFKFTGAPESIWIFQTLEDWSGIALFEPLGRYAVGAAELIASILIFVPGMTALAAVLGVCIMTGAIFFHTLGPLGISVFDDGGTLFYMACTVWLAAVVLLLKNKDQLSRK